LKRRRQKTQQLTNRSKTNPAEKKLKNEKKKGLSLKNGGRNHRDPSAEGKKENLINT